MSVLLTMNIVLQHGGGAKMEIMSWGTHSGLQGRVQQLLDD